MTNNQIMIIGLIFEVIGAFLVVIILIRTNAKIKDLCTYEDTGMAIGVGTQKKINEALENSFIKDRACAIFGIIFLLIGFIFQIIGNICS